MHQFIEKTRLRLTFIGFPSWVSRGLGHFPAVAESGSHQQLHSQLNAATSPGERYRSKLQGFVTDATWRPEKVEVPG
jgi:hypothetical protein